MKVVVDSNRVIAALLKDSTTREILYNDQFEFIAPELMIEEITKYKDVFIEKGKITSEEFEELLALLFEKITLIPHEEYENQLHDLMNKISDKKDTPFLACCLSTKAEGIWSHDPHFLEQKKVKVFTNKDLLDISKI